MDDMTVSASLINTVTVLIITAFSMTTSEGPACDKTVVLMADEGDEQELVPSGYPSVQPRDLTLCWVVLAPPGYRYIKGRALDSHLSLACDWENGDYVEVREGGTEHGSLLSRWCNKKSSNSDSEFTSTVHAVLVRMRTGRHNRTYRGFRLQYSGEGGRDDPACGSGVSVVYIPAAVAATLVVVLMIIGIYKCCCKADSHVVPLSQSDKSKTEIFPFSARRPAVPVITVGGYTAPKQPLYSYGGLPPNYHHPSSFGPRSPGNQRQTSPETYGYCDLPPGAADGGY